MSTYSQNCLAWLLIVISFATFVSFTNSLPITQPRVSNPFRVSTNNGRRMLLNTKQHFYNQTMDHFNYRPESYRTFRQKFVITDDYWGGAKNNAPIFVYLGAEEPIDSDLISAGLLHEFAPHFKALIVFIEHRYYGMSNPKGSMLKSVNDPESVGYFNSAQALADYAEIILFLKQHYKAQHSPVIVFGGSYGGMLATWFRLKYPHVAMGALASSAPIFMSTVPGDTYDNWVNKVYRDTSKSCYETIVRSWEEMAKLGSKSDGLLHLSKKFSTCSTLNNTDDLGSYLVRLYRKAAQYDAPPQYPLSLICQTIDGAANGATDLDKVAAAVSLFDNSDCLTVDSSAAIKPDSSSDQFTLGWSWQTCSELVNPMGTIFNSSITNTMIPVNPFDLQTFVQNCNDIYGVPTRPSWLNTYYGSRDLRLVLKRSGSNIIFSNGLKDPFSQEGVLESISETLVAIKAPYGSHCLDLHYAEDSDPKWLKAMRKKEAKIMKKWISIYYDDLRAYLNGH